MTTRRWLWLAASLSVLLVAVLTFQHGERRRAEDRADLDSSTVAAIEASSDCVWLQGQFAAASRNEAIDAHRAVSYMALVNARMRLVGCYEP